MKNADFIACHIGGGISVSAHQSGRMIDGFDIVGEEKDQWHLQGVEVYQYQIC